MTLGPSLYKYFDEDEHDDDDSAEDAVEYEGNNEQTVAYQERVLIVSHIVLVN